MLGKIKEALKFWGKEVRLKSKIDRLNSLLKNKKNIKSFITTLRSEYSLQLINDILLELWLQDEKWCYDSMFVNKVIEQLEQRKIFLDDDKYWKVILNIKNYLDYNLRSLPNIIKWLNLKEEKDVNKLITILNDPSLSSKILEHIVMILMTKDEFISWNIINFKYIVDLITTHSSFNEEILSKILLYKWKRKVIRWNRWWYMSKKKEDHVIYLDELELMFFKSYFIINPKIDLVKYRDELLKDEYLTIITSVFKNVNIELETKKRFIVKLAYQTLNKLVLHVKDIWNIDSEEIERFIKIIIFLKNPNNTMDLKKKLLDKLDGKDIFLIQEVLENKEQLSEDEKEFLKIIYNKS